MTVRSILIFPDSKLNQISAAVTDFGPSFQLLLQDLWDTLHSSPGVGLAAPQIGVLKKVSVIDLNRKKMKKNEPSAPAPYVIVNPVIREFHGQQIPREGCLSVPEFLGNVARYESIVVEAFNEYGHQIRREASGFEALALQHEIDHMQGTLFLDRITDLKSNLFRRN